MKHIITAIDRAMTAHVQGAAAINELRSAAGNTLAVLMPQFPDSRAVDDHLVRLAAAIEGVPEATVDWAHHNALRDALDVLRDSEGTLPMNDGPELTALNTAVDQLELAIDRATP